MKRLYLGKLNVDWITTNRALGLAAIAHQATVDQGSCGGWDSNTGSSCRRRSTIFSINISVFKISVARIGDQLLIPDAKVLPAVDSLRQNGDCRAEVTSVGGVLDLIADRLEHVTGGGAASSVEDLVVVVVVVKKEEKNYFLVVEKVV